MSCNHSAVRVDLAAFIHQKRIILRCDDCARVFPHYLEWIHRFDPQPSEHPSQPGPRPSPPRDADHFSFAREWLPWLVPAFAILVVTFVFLVA